MAEENTFQQRDEQVNHPSHYTNNSVVIEPIDICENLDFCRGNVLKYIARYQSKHPDNVLIDLKKALWYLTRYEINFKEFLTTDENVNFAFIKMFSRKSKNKILIDTIYDIRSVDLKSYFKVLKENLIKEIKIYESNYESNKTHI